MRSQKRSILSDHVNQHILILGICCVLLPVFLVSCTYLNAPRYEEAECQFYADTTREIECGILKVPEDRGQEDGPMIELHFAILRSSFEDTAPDPIIALSGGPGANALDMMDYWLGIFNTALAFRDVIVLDQRGVGYSQPSLNCPELEAPYYANFAQNLSTVEQDQRFTQALKSCRERLVQEGVNLSAYNSAASAADVDDLRRALGYSEWNLYGISYGTRLALTVMRDFPEGIRSVILDSVYPPQVDLFSSMAVDMQRALNLLFERCAADAECSRDYPDLEWVLFEVVDEVDAEPVTLSVDNPSDSKAYQVLINGDRLILSIFFMLYRTDYLPILPEVIYEIHAGDWEKFPSMIRWGQLFNDELSEGIYTSVQCVEEAPFGSPEEVETANAAANSRLSQAMNNAYIFQDCAAWQVTPGPELENQPVVSDIPTLILVGEHDPVTPPTWGKSAAEHLSRAQYIEFPGIAHGAFGSFSHGTECSSRKIVEAFLADPEAPIEASCVAEAPPLFGGD